ncbi:hypothetical protein FNV43_RR01949 [Rhamnella rubrinervis]|uniref:HMA domain-containing protein n=1 Tax=Rhamnella rubrinervis TaxID=2594499 RepID=A0A8K0HQK2_9ROSA|nr:hypothetical protein FNV43_RR01949 [Rhamnella rubrinervis]
MLRVIERHQIIDYQIGGRTDEVIDDPDDVSGVAVDLEEEEEMGDQDFEEAIVAEFGVSMHCNACERSVAKTISKLKGVEKFSTDMNNHRVVVMGKFDPQKVAKKLRKKTGKKVYIVADNEEDHEPKDTGANCEGDHQAIIQGITDLNPFLIDYNCKEMEMLMMFSDENPNACLVM